jgi:hypothetical protein
MKILLQSPLLMTQEAAPLPGQRRSPHSHCSAGIYGQAARTHPFPMLSLLVLHGGHGPVTMPGMALMAFHGRHHPVTMPPVAYPRAHLEVAPNILKPVRWSDRDDETGKV